MNKRITLALAAVLSITTSATADLGDLSEKDQMIYWNECVEPRINAMTALDEAKLYITKGNTSAAQDATNLYKIKAKEATQACKAVESKLPYDSYEDIALKETAENLAELNEGIKNIKPIDRVKENARLAKVAASEYSAVNCDKAMNKIITAVNDADANTDAEIEEAMLDFAKTEVGLLATLRVSECEGEPQDKSDKALMVVLKKKEVDGTIKSTEVDWVPDFVNLIEGK